MRRTRFDESQCPIARTTDLFGDWWTPLVLRQAFWGDLRFADFREHLEIPRAVLSARLSRLCEEGILRKDAYQDNPPRYEYRLTEKGKALWDVLLAMWAWGEEWAWPEGDSPELVLKSRETGQAVKPVVVDEWTGERLTADRTRAGRRRPPGIQQGV